MRGAAPAMPSTNEKRRQPKNNLNRVDLNGAAKCTRGGPCIPLPPATCPKSGHARRPLIVGHACRTTFPVRRWARRRPARLARITVEVTQTLTRLLIRVRANGTPCVASLAAFRLSLFAEGPAYVDYTPVSFRADTFRKFQTKRRWQALSGTARSPSLQLVIVDRTGKRRNSSRKHNPEHFLLTFYRHRPATRDAENTGPVAQAEVEKRE